MAERKQPKSFGELRRENRWNFLPELAGGIGIYVAFLAFIFAALWIGDAAGSPTLAPLIMLGGLFIFLGLAISFEGAITGFLIPLIGACLIGCLIAALLWLLGLLGIHMDRFDIFGFGMLVGSILTSVVYAWGLIAPDWKQRAESDAYNAGVREGRRQAEQSAKGDQAQKHASEDDELDKEAEELLRRANYPGDLEKYFAVLREHGLTMRLAGTWRDDSRGRYEKWEFSGGPSERPTNVIVRFWHDTGIPDWQGTLHSGKEIKEQSSGKTLRKLNLYLERWTGKG